MVGREFARYIGAPVPNDIKQSMTAFLAGEFTGADRSPLAYVGYRVGKTNGLPKWDRKTDHINELADRVHLTDSSQQELFRLL